jgi:hypothetical protein
MKGCPIKGGDLQRHERADGGGHASMKGRLVKAAIVFPKPVKCWNAQPR